MDEKDLTKFKKEINNLEKIIDSKNSTNKEKAEAYKKILTIYPEISDEMYPVIAFIKETPYGKPGANRKKSRKPLSQGELVGKQKEIDANNDGEISEEDFELLRQQKQEGGSMSMDEQMQMAMNQPMLPDEEMEDNYLDFIIDEALTEEEEDMLMSKLEQDEQLSMLFDKVLEVASEFAGSGPVEGPGSGVSDSIPARLSDGEFVFTAKATEEIGADELMRMMKDAEANADKRQQMANGGEPEEETMTRQTNEPNVQEIRVVKETVDSAGKMMEDEDEISKDIKSQMMLDPNQRHVRS